MIQKFFILVIISLFFLSSGKRSVPVFFSYDSTRSCKFYFNEEIKSFLTLDTKSVQIVELKNGLIYINGKGFLSLVDGTMFSIKDSVDRLRLYQILGDSILSFRSQKEQIVLNLLTDYHYYKKKWSTKIFATQLIVESYNGNVVPIYDNDSSILITSLRDNRILGRVSGDGAFSNRIFSYKEHFYLSDNTTCYKVALNGTIAWRFPMESRVSSDLLFENEKIFFWSKGLGLLTLDESGALLSRYHSLNNSKHIKLVCQPGVMYFNDRNLRAIDLHSGEELWVNNNGPLATDNNNWAVSQKFIVTGLYRDSDASTVLIDKNTGGLICDGYDMENGVGLDRYTFFRFTTDDGFYAMDGGGYGYQIVKITLKK